jgi:hypothetical protein
LSKNLRNMRKFCPQISNFGKWYYYDIKSRTSLNFDIISQKYHLLKNDLKISISSKKWYNDMILYQWYYIFQCLICSYKISCVGLFIGKVQTCVFTNSFKSRCSKSGCVVGLPLVLVRSSGSNSKTPPDRRKPHTQFLPPPPISPPIFSKHPHLHHQFCLQAFRHWSCVKGVQFCCFEWLRKNCPFFEFCGFFVHRVNRNKVNIYACICHRKLCNFGNCAIP